MKKILLFAIPLFLIVSVAQAQIPKGSVLLGGNLAFASNKIGSGPTAFKSSRIIISPSAGFTIKDNQVVGVSFDYVNMKDYNDETYGGGIFYRRYLPLGKSFYVFGQANTGYSYNKRAYPTGIDSRDRLQTQTIGLSLYPGVTYAVSKRFHLEASLNNLVQLYYAERLTESYTGSLKSVSKYKGFNFSMNGSPESNLKLGFRIVLGK